MKIQDGLNSEPVENVIKPGLWNHQQNLESWYGRKISLAW